MLSHVLLEHFRCNTEKQIKLEKEKVGGLSKVSAEVAANSISLWEFEI